MARWNVNLLILMAGVVDILLASAINLALVPAMAPRLAPLLIGCLAAVALLFWARPWLYLVAGILAAAFPLVIIFVFGASGALTHPGGGWEALSVALLLLGSVLTLLGGILGFAQGRGGRAQPPVRGGIRTTQGLATLLVVGLFLGWATANAYATTSIRDTMERPVSHADSVDEHIRIVTTGIAYAPKSITLTAGKLTSLDIENDDPVLHTFSYHLADGLHEAPIPPHSKISILLKFDTPQVIHVWCAPHSSGETDRSDEGMWMNMTVA